MCFKYCLPILFLVLMLCYYMRVVFCCVFVRCSCVCFAFCVCSFDLFRVVCSCWSFVCVWLCFFPTRGLLRCFDKFGVCIFACCFCSVLFVLRMFVLTECCLCF